jgi:cell division inhibitor SepF
MGLAQSLRAVVGQIGGAYDEREYEDVDDDAFPGPDESARDDRAARPLAVVRPPHVEFMLVAPRDFDSAQQIADHLRASRPVIVDLQGCGPDLTKRLTDFCSGLTYALEGSLQDVGDTVMLLLPRDLELSGGAPGELRERRFFNQV